MTSQSFSTSAELYSHTLAPFWKRLLARLFDTWCVGAVALIPPFPLGVVLGLFYVLLADGIGRSFHASIGKRIFRMKVIDLHPERTGQQHPYRSRWWLSVKRNTPLAILTLYALIPIWGWMLYLLVGLPLLLLEVFFYFRSHGKRQRLGDLMADTCVVMRPRKSLIVEASEIFEGILPRE